MLFEFQEVLVKDVMDSKYITLKEDHTLKEAINLMLENNIQEIFIENRNNKIQGVVTLADISNVYDDLSKDILLKRFIVNNLITISKDNRLLECRDIMMENEIGRLPVMEDDKLIGVIRVEQIRDHFYMNLERISIMLHHIVENIHEALCLIDKNGKVLIWNKNAEKLYDVSQEEIIGENIRDFFPDAINSKVLETKKIMNNICHSPKADYRVIINALPIFINDKFEGVLTTDRDITEVTNLLNELEKANDTLKFLEDEVKKFKSDNFGNIIGKSPKLMEKIKVARQVAKTEVSVLVTGESGTGKEVFARAIHDHSGVKGLFVPVNCSAIPSELFESEFFGYDQGAFTGANRKGKIGFFELANNGTLFLDEIGDLPMFMQAKLLRVLQDNKFTRVGGEKFINTNVRIISATNKNLLDMVKKGTFREDLFYRLNVIEIELPPLRKRRKDIILLVYNFLKELSKKNGKKIPEISPEVLDILKKYSWKGNIRELKNTIEHLLVLSNDDIIHEDMLPKHILEEVEKDIKSDEDIIEDSEEKIKQSFDLNKYLSNLEMKLISKALNKSSGNKAKAAKLLKIPRSTLHYKINQYDIKE
ncbi:sigma 54-interacting transcriptional regulator [Clostridium sp. D2Q-14]|uniref:sigma-54 dependent transcriptional regulator PrdR n=1 Tax=Anaeromonas gelatinilytica TaxID=2683194 RepID=UPI00193BA4FC|nr:sigma-54 dependent transcriptional regulator PrdR [Anaeromonas gelatinilytica]MBS4536337.1 sigma 54-interacting transcriptional regulator [Anaeromonas gelatinilytica]